jgi:2'-5' RNA ligase
VYLSFMRAFIALPISDPIKNRLAEAVRRHTPLGQEIVWCRREQFHVTLAFLGEISPAILPHLTASLERVCSAHPAFACRANGFGFFGSKRTPKTIWAGVDPASELETLYEHLWEELKRLGYERREKDFRPHITLGRSRDNAARNLALVEALDADEDASFGTWRADRVALYESRQTPHGAVYRVLAQASLADA